MVGMDPGLSLSSGRPQAGPVGRDDDWELKKCN